MATVDKAREQRIAGLERLRELLQAIVDDNRHLEQKRPSQHAFAERRILDVARQLDALDRELAELRSS